MKRYGFIAALLILSGAKYCFAEKLDKNFFEIATEYSLIAYKEQGVMKQSGSMNYAVASYANFDTLFIKAEVRAGYGQVDYSSVGTGDMDSVDDSLLELRGLAGYNIFEDEEGMMMIPYLGMGYRYLEDDSQGRTTTTGALGYKRESNYYYIPCGVEMTLDMDKDCFFGLVLEYDFFVHGVQKSYLSGAVAGLNDLENSQHKGRGYRASLKIKKQILSADLIFEPFIRYWRIEESESANISYSGVIIGLGHEPKNFSKEYGFKIGMSF